MKKKIFLGTVLAVMFLELVGVSRVRARDGELTFIQGSEINLAVKALTLSKTFSFGEDDKENPVGVLTWDKGRLEFKGNADASAKNFFEVYLQDLVDEYIAANSYISLNCPGEAKKEEVPPKTKCDELDFKHAWGELPPLPTASYPIYKYPPDPIQMPPRRERCINCGLERILKIKHSEHWEHQLP